MSVSTPKPALLTTRRAGCRRSRAIAAAHLVCAVVLLVFAGTVSAGKVHALRIDGAIGPATANYVVDGIRSAENADAEAVLLRLDTPGGLDKAMRDIIRAILNADVPVIGYVSPAGARAASAGTYILYASHVAAMAPGTNLGAATPVTVGGGTPTPGEGDDSAGEVDGKGGDTGGETDAKERKRINDAVAYIRSLAALRGRNADWAERAVREAASLPAQAAVEAQVVDLRSRNASALLGSIDGRKVAVRTGERRLDTSGAPVVERSPDWRDRLLGAISHPNVAYILMLLGVYGLIFELANPGAIVPGVIGGIALLLALFAFQILGVDYAGLALLVLGIGLMLAEAFAPSFGALGLGGAAAFAAGSLLLFDAEGPGFALSRGLVFGATVVSVIVFLGTGTLAARAFRRPVVAGVDHLKGAPGSAVDGFDQMGYVRVRGELWRARTKAPVGAEQAVRVTAVEGLELIVEPASDDDGLV